MAIIISQGSGATLASANINGEHFSFTKVVDGNVSAGTIPWNILSDGSGQMALRGNVTLSDPKGYIGLVSVQGTVAVSGTPNVAVTNTPNVAPVGNLTLSDSKGFIGLVSVGGGSIAISGTPNVAISGTPNVAVVGNLTLSDPKGFIGLISVQGTVAVSGTPNVSVTNQPNVAVVGNVTLSDSKGYIGLVTATPGAAWPDPKTYIGLASVQGTVGISGTPNVAVVGNITLTDSKGFIGLVTAQLAAAWPDPKTYIGLVTITGALSAAAGNVTLDPGSKTGIVGNVTLSDAKTYIGLVTATIGGTLPAFAAAPSVQSFGQFLPVLQSIASGGLGPMALDNFGRQLVGDSKGYIGLVTIDIGTNNSVAVKGNVTLSDSKAFIGLVSVGGGSIAISGTPNVAVVGNVTLSDPKGFIGLVTLGGGTAWADPKGYIGLVTITGALSAAAGNVTLDPGSRTGIVGNLTLSDSKGFIGLVTAVGSFTTTFAGNVTLDPGSKTGIVGNLTLSDPKGYIGLVSVGGGSIAISGTPNVAISGNVVVDPSSSTHILLDNDTAPTGIGTDSDTFFSSGPNAILAVSVPYYFNSTASIYERTRTANSYSGATGIGMEGNAFFGVNGQKFYPIQVGTDGRLQGNVTVNNPLSIAGNVTLSDPKGFIGLVTVVTDRSDILSTGNKSALYVSSASGTVMNVTLRDGGGNSVGVDGPSFGLFVKPVANSNYIGLVTIDIGTNNSVAVKGNVTLSDSKGFIGLVTAWMRNAGTTKTLLTLPITLSSASQQTIAVPTNNQIVYITSATFSSDATVRVSIKSGVTYLTGNATIGITLNPGGGFIDNGGPDSPTWIGLPSGALIIEKFDMTGTKANLGGKITYFSE